MDTLPAIHQAPRRAEVIRLLESVALPSSDLADEHMTDFFHASSAFLSKRL
jgi:hypothetical protein